MILASPSCSDILNTCASCILICSTASVGICGGIPTTPEALFTFDALILQATTSEVTNNCPNLKAGKIKGVVTVYNNTIKR